MWSELYFYFKLYFLRNFQNLKHNIMETSNLLQDILGHDNTARQRAEAELNTQRTSNPAALLQLFIANMRSEKVEVAQISCILFKKYFLDNSEGISTADYETMKQAVMDSLDFKTQPILLLKRKGDVLSKIFSLQDKNEDLLNLLVQWAQSEDPISKQFAMYVFEILSECHLSGEQLKKYKDSFFTIFDKSLQDGEIKVRVAALKATTSFLYSIEDESIVNNFKSLMEKILNTVVEALKTDETQGKLALESMVDLTKTHPACWKETSAQLVTILSDVITMTDFEDGTRTQAAEVVLTLAGQVPATLRKIPDMKTKFFPALVKMLTEVEEDNEEWAQKIEGEDTTGTDIHTSAISAIGRLSLDMKENFMLDAVKPVFAESFTHADWKVRQAGYLTFGLIAESCKDYMKANMDHAMQTACKGLQDENARVRYSGLSCLGLVLTELSPIAQTKFHQELMPALLNIMQNEKILKIQTHAISCMINFTKGLIQEDENEINDTKKSSDILNLYADSLFQNLHVNLEKGIKENYEPLQEEVMNLLNVSATLIEDQFAKYFNHFMPLMIEILDSVQATNQAQMNLRARTFESIGFMISAVQDNQEFMPTVKQVTEKLFGLLNSTFAHDDPQEGAVKEALTKIAFYLKEDFQVVAPKFLEILVNDANLEIDIKQENAQLPSTADAKANSFEFKLKGMENSTRVTFNTSDLGNKIQAFKHILQLAEAMGSAFTPYIQVISPVLKKHITHFSKEIRKAAMKTFQYLLTALGEGNNMTLFKEVYGLFSMNILMANKKENIKEVKLLYKEMFHCMKVISNSEQVENTRFFENEGQMTSFIQLMGQCLNTVSVNKEHQLATIEEKNKNDQIDEEDEAEIKEELYKITGAATYINECANIIMTTYKQAVSGLIEESCKPYFRQVLNEYRVVSERELQDATFFFMQYIDNCNSTDFMFIIELCQ